MPNFHRYIIILIVWQELHSQNPSTIMEYQHETIWNNRFIRIDGEPVSYSSWYRKGVTKIYHLLNESGKRKGKKSILNSELLIAVRNTTSLPRTSRPKLLVKRLSWKYLNLRIRVERKLVEQNFSAKAIYELPYKVTMENKLKYFHYNVVHDILPTNSNLYKMKLRISPSCDRSSHPKKI